MKRQCWLAVAVASVVLAAGSVQTKAAGQQLTQVRIIGTTKSLNFVPLYVAQTMGYFKDEGLEPEVSLVGGGPKAMTSLLGGAGDFAFGALQDGMAVHRAGRKDTRAIASTMASYALPIMLSVEKIKQAGISRESALDQRIKALKGMRLGISTPGSGTDNVLRYVAMSQGLMPDRDLVIVPIGGVDAMLAALQAKQIDGCSCFPPIDSIAESRGIAKTILDPGIDLEEIRGINYITLSTTTTVLKDKPAVVHGVIKALSRGADLIRTDPVAAKAATKPFFAEMDAATFDGAWDRILPILPRTLMITKEGWDKELALQKKVMPAAAATDVQYDQVVDMGPVQAVLKELGR